MCRQTEFLYSFQARGHFEEMKIAVPRAAAGGEFVDAVENRLTAYFRR